MYVLILGSVILSLLHAIIPNHWLPIVAIGRKENWSPGQIMRVTAICALSHVASTLLIGWGLAFFGWEFAKHWGHAFTYFSSTILIVIGLIFIYRHYRHKHFHVQDPVHQSSKAKMISSLVVAMFFSPCLEVEAYFLAAGEQLIWTVVLSFVYASVTIVGMVSWVYIANHGLQKMNWHKLEHNAGIITGFTIIVSGLLSFWLR